MNDVSASIRASVIKLLLRILIDLESLENSDSEEIVDFSNKIFQMMAMKVFVTEEVSALAHSCCLIILFKSFMPHEKALKKIVGKSTSGASSFMSASQKNDSQVLLRRSMSDS